MTDTPTLKRSITLPLLILFGLGTMVGGGFYALIGKVAGSAGMATPLAMGLTGLLALLSAFSFAELSSRYPVSAGESRYVLEGFGSIGLSSLTGWLVIATGIVSAATLAVATVGFLLDMFAVPESLAIAALVILMGAVAGRGIGHSVILVTLITVIELGALLYIVWVNAAALPQIPAALPRMLPNVTGNGNAITWVGVFSGAFLAFYAFVGFEDMVNMAEEVKDTERNLPVALISTIIMTTLIYVIVSMVAVISVPVDELEQSRTPMAVLAGPAGQLSATGIWLVSLLTGVNGALVQIIMAARVAYGMARRKQAPAWFAVIHPGTCTPLNATAAMTMIILLLALFFPLTTLAKLTSTIILVIFALVNLSLWRVKGRDPDLTGNGPRYPRWLPLAGCMITVAVLLFHGVLMLR